MVVRNSEAHPDKLIYGNKDGVILVAGYGNKTFLVTPNSTTL